MRTCTAWWTGRNGSRWCQRHSGHYCPTGCLQPPSTQLWRATLTGSCLVCPHTPYRGSHSTLVSHGRPERPYTTSPYAAVTASTYRHSGSIMLHSRMRASLSTTGTTWITTSNIAITNYSRRCVHILNNKKDIYLLMTIQYSGVRLLEFCRWSVGLVFPCRCPRTWGAIVVQTWAVRTGTSSASNDSGSVSSSPMWRPRKTPQPRVKPVEVATSERTLSVHLWILLRCRTSNYCGNTGSSICLSQINTQPARERLSSMLRWK